MAVLVCSGCSGVPAIDDVEGAWVRYDDGVDAVETECADAGRIQLSGDYPFWTLRCGGVRVTVSFAGRVPAAGSFTGTSAVESPELVDYNDDVHQLAEWSYDIELTRFEHEDATQADVAGRAEAEDPDGRSIRAVWNGLARPSGPND